MTLLEKIEIPFKEPRKFYFIIVRKLCERFPFFFSDSLYLKARFYLVFGYKLNLKSPKTYSEKIQWLKLYDRRPVYTTMVDKAESKRFVSQIIGEKYIIPTIKVYDSFDDINFAELPDQFVLKTTHDSGGVVICRDKDSFDINAAKEKLTKSLKTDYYLINREWPYKNVPKKILAETYMVDSSQPNLSKDNVSNLNDYKFFCFDGKVKALFIASDRFNERGEEENVKFDFFDRDFNHLPFTNGHPNSTNVIVKPSKYEEMVSIAEKLSEGIPQLRVDLYNINGNIYFGELTFFHWSGFMPFKPKEWDETFGGWIKLPSKKE